MFESIINSSELEIPCKFVLRTEFYFFLIDDNHVWEPLRRFQSSNRQDVENHYVKLNTLLKSKPSLTLNNRSYPTDRLYLSKIEQRSEYRLFVSNQEVPLHHCVNVIMDRLVEDKLITNTSNDFCTLVKAFDLCDSIEIEYFDPETLIYDQSKNNFYNL